MSCSSSGDEGRTYAPWLADGADEVAGGELAEDVDRADALIDDGHRFVELGDHAAGDRAVGDRGARLGAGDASEARGGIVDVAEHAGRGGDEEQPRGFERGGELVADEVGVDVEDVALGVGAEAGDHGDVACGPERGEEIEV